MSVQPVRYKTLAGGIPGIESSPRQAQQRHYWGSKTSHSCDDCVRISGPEAPTDCNRPLQVVRIIPTEHPWLITNKSGRYAHTKEWQPPTHHFDLPKMFTGISTEISFLTQERPSCLD